MKTSASRHRARRALALLRRGTLELADFYVLPVEIPGYTRRKDRFGNYAFTWNWRTWSLVADEDYIRGGGTAASIPWMKGRYDPPGFRWMAGVG